MKNSRLRFLAALLLLGLAACGPPQVELNVQLTGDGVGAVASQPPGLSCSAEVCTGRFDKGTRVTLEPEPSTNSGFVAWGGACDGAIGCEVVLDAPKEVEAAFERTQFVLSVARARAAQGRVVSIPEGIDCGEDCQEVSKEGIRFSLQAFPAEGAVFGGWGGDCSDEGVVCLVELNNDKNVVANFTFPPPTIERFTVTPNSILSGQSARLEWGVKGKGKVKLAISPDVGDVTGRTSAIVRPNDRTVYTLKATSEFGSVEKKVTLDVTPSATLTVVVEGGGAIESVNPLNVINCGSTGSDCSEIFKVNTEVTLQATQGVLIRWTGCETSFPRETCTLIMTGDKTVTAIFP